MTAPVVEAKASERAATKPPAPARRRGFAVHFAHYKWLYLLLLPGVLYFAIFRYGPMYGVSIAFKDYVPFLGVNGSPWVGVTNFTDFFANPDFPRLLGNTLILAFLNLGIAFPLTDHPGVAAQRGPPVGAQAHRPDARLHPALPVLDHRGVAHLPALRPGHRAVVPVHQQPLRNQRWTSCPIPNWFRPVDRAPGQSGRTPAGEPSSSSPHWPPWTRTSTRQQSSTARADSVASGTSPCLASGPPSS